MIQICLFGSVAHGDCKWNSDIDLAIITKQPVLDRSLKGEIIDNLDMDIDGVSSDVIFRTSDTQGLSKTFDIVFELGIQVMNL